MHKAQKVALETAQLNSIDQREVRRVVDTFYAKCFPCWRVTDYVVVYEDDADAVVSIASYHGRLVKV